jgi:hypothetical protein
MINISWRTIQAVSFDSLTTLAVKARTCNRIRLGDCSSSSSSSATSSNSSDTNRGSSSSWMMPTCWQDLIKSYDDRLHEYDNLIDHFVFILPKVVSTGISLASKRSLREEESANARQVFCENFKKSFNNAIRPFYKISMRQTIFFPDR